MSGETTGTERLHLLTRDLPYVDERSSDGCLVGLLVFAEEGFVRLVAGAHAFTFAVADVLDVATLDEFDALGTGPLGVRLTLKVPATLVKVENWAEFQHAALGTRRPFAYLTRPHPIVAPPRTEFRERELRYIRALE
jgi:hypothetical protein